MYNVYTWVDKLRCSPQQDSDKYEETWYEEENEASENVDSRSVDRQVHGNATYATDHTEGAQAGLEGTCVEEKGRNQHHYQNNWNL